MDFPPHGEVFYFYGQALTMYIYPLSRIHNTSLVSAYFGLDRRECESLEYYYYLLKEQYVV
jgi:hypothetical protein